MRAYYKKFQYVWISMLSVLEMYWVGNTLGIVTDNQIALLGRLPNAGKMLVLLLLLCNIVMQVLLRHRDTPAAHKLRLLGSVMVLLILFDGTVLRLADRVVLVSAMTSTPDGMLDSMIYMAINSQKIWLNGLAGTLKVSLLGTVIGFVLAILLVFLRVNPPARRDRTFVQLLKTIGYSFEKFYVSFVRGTPMMVQGCVIYYAGFMAVRALMPTASITAVNNIWTFFTAALITVSLNTSAYLAEVLRGGVEALDRGQREACDSLGFTKWQALTKVIFPQAVKNAMPSIANEFINNIKGTSVLNVFGFVELMFATSSVAGFYYKYLASYLIAAILYYLLTFSMTWILNLAMKASGLAVQNG